MAPSDPSPREPHVYLLKPNAVLISIAERPWKHSELYAGLAAEILEYRRRFGLLSEVDGEGNSTGKPMHSLTCNVLHRPPRAK